MNNEKQSPYKSNEKLPNPYFMPATMAILLKIFANSSIYIKIYI